MSLPFLILAAGYLLSTTEHIVTVQDPLPPSYSVVVFVSPSCPVSRVMTPKVLDLQRQFGPVVTWTLIIAEDEPDSAEIAEYINDFQITVPVVVDTDQDSVRKYNATTYPEAFVRILAGDVVYRGRIDDSFLTLGKRRTGTLHHSLKLALEALRDGRQEFDSVTTPVGCRIERRE